MPDSATPERTILEAEYLRLIRTVLPALGAREGWVVKLDHCFGRIMLDHVFQGPWREHLNSKTAAYKQLSTEQLGRATALATRIENEGGSLLRELNCQSLKWRGKGIDARKEIQ